MKRVDVALNPPRRVNDFVVFANRSPLVPGTMAWVRARAVTAAGPSDWLAPVCTFVE
jgi:hypothetical protein